MRSWLALCAVMMLATSSARGQDDTEGPLIDHEPVAMTVSGKPLLIVATITDANGVFEPAVLYRVGGEGTFVSVPMEPAGEGNAYTATLPGNIIVAEVEYFIEAFDELGNGPSREGDADLPLVVRVIEPNAEAPPPDDGESTGDDTSASGNGGDEAGEAEEGSGLGLWLGVGGAAAGAAIVAVAAAAAGGAAAYYFLVLNNGNTTPSQVTVTVSSPSPTSAALTAGAP